MPPISSQQSRRVPGLNTALVVALVVPLVLLGALAWRSYSRVWQETWREVDATNDLAAEHIAKVFETIELLAEKIDAQVADRSWDEIAADRALFEELRARDERLPQIHGIWLSDASGTTRASSRAFPTPPYDISGRSFFRVPRDEGRPYVSELVTGRHSGDTVFAVGWARRTYDRFDGVISIIVSPGYFEQVFADAVARISGSILVVRAETTGRDGDVLARIPRIGAPRMLGARSPVFGALTSGGAPVRYRVVSQLDGIERIHTARRVGGYPLLVSTGTPVSVVRARWAKEWRDVAVFAVPLYLALIVAVLFARRHLLAERALRATLESRVAERTVDLARLVAEKDVLLREIHHRVKNNLQMMQSMVRLTAQRAPRESEPHFSDVARRIWAVGQLYNQLYTRGDVSSVDLRGYLTSLCSNASLFGDEEGIELVCDVDPIDVDLDTAIPLGLITVELVTNAHKHAFPGAAGGRVTVRLAKAQEDGGRAVLTVADDGIGLPADRDPTRNGGMGMRLVNALVAQIDGTLAVTGDGGTRWTVVFPLRARDREQVA